MKRILPHPILSLALLGVWLLLNQPSLGHLILGTAIAILAGRSFALIEPRRQRIGNPRAMAKLFGMVFVDIIRSNIAVAWLIITRGNNGTRRSAFVEIKLRLRDPMALAVLSMVVTATPGTAWIEYDADSSSLLLHVYDHKETSDWAAIIGDRYEALLMEIFP